MSRTVNSEFGLPWSIRSTLKVGRSCLGWNQVYVLKLALIYNKVISIMSISDLSRYIKKYFPLENKNKCCKIWIAFSKLTSVESTTMANPKKQRQNQINSLKCEICDKEFKSKNSLNNHVNNAHNPKEVHQCNICQNVFNIQA